MELDTYVAKIRDFAARNRAAMLDLLVVLTAIVACAYYCYEVDVFPNRILPLDHMIEDDEWPIIATVASIGMLFFAWRRTREHKREIHLREEAEKKAWDLAMLDALTGLPNRRQFLEVLDTTISSTRVGECHALMLLDLNGFKRINDTYGHSAGDFVLVAVGERLRSLLRKGDISARLGGDEFAVLAKDVAGPQVATGIALGIIDALLSPIERSDASYAVGTGIGVALLPFNSCNVEEAMRRADIALYKAKADPRSSPQFFDEEMGRHVKERGELEQALRAAVLSKIIEPYFQPLVDLKTKQIVSFEVLARWTDPKLGVIPPDRFIPIAEDIGLIHELSAHLLTKACATAVTWPVHVRMAFNISCVQLRDHGLPRTILATLANAGLAPERLEVEITETALVRDLEGAQAILGTLRLAGVRVALDDFGTGYSSLYHLRNFKIDELKIDSSFVRAMEHEHESLEIVSALIGLGRGLGLTVTAEGIENAPRCADLIARGCTHGQGFLFGNAVSGAETGEIIAASVVEGNCGTVVRLASQQRAKA